MPIEAAAGLDEHAAAIDVTRKFNTLLEGWILENPRDWFAAKRRWPKTAFS